MSDGQELKDLREAFPGIWVREDGAFRYEPFGMFWEPGDVESDLTRDPAVMYEVGSKDADGRLSIRGGDYGHATTRLKLSQLWALTNYIDAHAPVRAIQPPAPPTVSDREKGESEQVSEERWPYSVSYTFAENGFGDGAYATIFEAREEFERFKLDPKYLTVVLKLRDEVIDTFARPAPEVRKEDEQDAAACTCHPEEAPSPCQHQYALRDCQEAAFAAFMQQERAVAWTGEARCPLNVGTPVTVLWSSYKTQDIIIDSFWNHADLWQHHGQSDDFLAYLVTDPNRCAICGGEWSYDVGLDCNHEIKRSDQPPPQEAPAIPEGFAALDIFMQRHGAVQVAEGACIEIDGSWRDWLYSDGSIHRCVDPVVIHPHPDLGLLIVAYAPVLVEEEHEPGGASIFPEASADAERIEDDRQGTDSIEQTNLHDRPKLTNEEYESLEKLGEYFVDQPTALISEENEAQSASETPVSSTVFLDQAEAAINDKSEDEPVIHPDAAFWAKALPAEAEAKAQDQKFNPFRLFGTLVGEGV